MTNRIIFICILWLLALVDHHDCSVILKRMASPDSDNSESTTDNLNSKYDEYPMVVPKRAAMLLDRIIVALSHALEDNDEKGVQRITDLYKSNRHIANDARFQKETMHRLRGTEDDINIYGFPYNLNEEPGSNGIDIGQYTTDESMVGLQRRGHGEGLGLNKNRVYWRCYFNAVTCF